MIVKSISGLFICASIVSMTISLVACYSGSVNAEKDASVYETSSSQVPSSLTLTGVSELCANLRNIKKFPYDRAEKTNDPIREGLLSAGDDAIPCLIEKITDVEKISDPNVFPLAHDFRVGDAALFLLMDITGESWESSTMLPLRVTSKLPQKGVDAYFEYVQKPENRQRIQTWWRNWADKKLKNR